MPRLSEEDRRFFTELTNNLVKAAVSSIKATLTTELSEIVNAAIASALDKAITPLQNEIADFRGKIESLQEKIIEKNNKINELEDKLIASTQRNVQQFGKLHNTLREKFDLNEQYSRKDSLRISGIPIEENETNATLQSALIEKLSEHNVIIKDSDIFRLHRSSKPSPLNKYKEYINKTSNMRMEIDPNDKSETADMIVRFANWPARANVYSLHYVKDIDLRVKTDRTQYRQELLQLVRDKLKNRQLKAYSYSTAECKLVVKDVTTNKRHYYTNFDEFKF